MLFCFIPLSSVDLTDKVLSCRCIKTINSFSLFFDFYEFFVIPSELTWNVKIKCRIFAINKLTIENSVHHIFILNDRFSHHKYKVVCSMSEIHSIHPSGFYCFWFINSIDFNLLRKAISSFQNDCFSAWKEPHVLCLTSPAEKVNVVGLKYSIIQIETWQYK